MIICMHHTPIFNAAAFHQNTPYQILAGAIAQSPFIHGDMLITF